jgi:hypothetical protein
VEKSSLGTRKKDIYLGTTDPINIDHFHPTKTLAPPKKTKSRRNNCDQIPMKSIGINIAAVLGDVP